MPERQVYCGGLRPPRTRSDALLMDLAAPRGTLTRVNLELGDLAKRLADNIPDELTDLLEIAAYVYCADQFTKRGTSQMTAMGAEWRRRFYFKIPVRRPAVWARAEVRNALVELLQFLSEDEYDFEFYRADNPSPLQSYFGFADSATQVILPDEIILFSGGLDSLSGATQAMLGNEKQVVLVSHQSSTMMASRRNTLLAGLRERTRSGSLFFVPVEANKGQRSATEFTQRSRSLLFASLGFIVAQMFRLKHLSFYENGIVSINLPIAEHVLGTRASRTTHPRVLADCSKLFSLLLSETFKVHNPYLWQTKADVLRCLAKHGCSDLIAHSVSCTRIRQATKTMRQCGVCSQCVDRRVAILAAKLDGIEPRETYEVDLFTGAHSAGPDLTMIESFVLRAQKFATMSEQAFAANFGQVFRVLPHLPGPTDENLKRIWGLHRRHGQEVISVVDGQLKSYAGLSDILQLPDTSLLKMIMSAVANQSDYVDPIELEPLAVEQAKLDSHSYAVNEIRCAVDSKARRILFDGGIALRGSAYELLAALAEECEADWEAGTFPDHHHFVRAKDLAKKLGLEEASFRRRVSRTRQDIKQAFLTNLDRQLLPDDVIENKGWNGYRLNPYVLLVKPGQMRKPLRSKSQLDSPDVPSRGRYA